MDNFTYPHSNKVSIPNQRPIDKSQFMLYYRALKFLKINQQKEGKTMNILAIIVACVVVIIAFCSGLFWWDDHSYPMCPECRDNSSSSRISRQTSFCAKHKLLFIDPPKNRTLERDAHSLSRQLFLK